MLATQAWLGKRLEGRRFSRAYTYTRIHTTGVLFFCCHKCHRNCATNWILRKNLRCKNTAYFIFKTSSKNDTLFWGKRHVVFGKTIRCFSENDTLFLGKRHVVLVKTTCCLRGIMGGFKKDFPTILLWVCFSEDYANTVTLVTAKKQKLLWCARVHARENSFIIVMATDSDNKYQNFFFLYFIK